jgi:hypothetical protein
MSNKREFTDKELQEMGTRTLDLLLAAIDAGDKAKAKNLAERMYKEFNYLHDGFMFWVTGLLTHIYKKYGIDGVEQAEREAHTIEGKVAFKPSEKRDFRSRVEHMVSGLRGHLQPIVIKEDDEKVCIAMKPCGSGERIMLKGGYKPEIGLGIVKEAHPATWGMKNLPLYCVHCPVMEMLDIEKMGDFEMTHFISDPICKESCQFVFYKNNADIPEKFYTRIGKKKPSAPKKK